MDLQWPYAIPPERGSRMSKFTERTELRIGKIIEVSGESMRVELNAEIGDLSRVVDGRVYSVGQLGSIVKVHYGRRLLFAYVRLLRMRSEIAVEEGTDRIAAGDDSRILEADLFAQGVWRGQESGLTINRGVEIYPLPLQGVYLATAEELDELFLAAERAEDQNGVSPLVTIGSYVGSNGAICRANIDKLIGQHCVVLGSTGSGKSGTVAALIHSILDHKCTADQTIQPRIVIIDPHGEYGNAFKNRCQVLRAYASAAEGCAGVALRLPYWLMSGDELRTLIIGKTEAEATSQNNIVYKALKHARMVTAGIVAALPDSPNGDEAVVLCPGKKQADVTAFDRDKPIRFSLDEFEKHIHTVQGRKSGTQTPLSNSDRKSHDSILDKLNVLRTDPRLQFLILDNPEDTLNASILQLTGAADNASTVKVIDISGAPNEVAGTLTAIICRLLFNFKVWQTRTERERDPIMIVCEEAHRYVPDRGEAQYKEAQEAVRRIAKEGRKYGLGLMLVSQRPSDLESTVLSQCNSWLILRLTNGADQDHVRRFLPDSLSGISKMLTSLGRREAVFVGEAAALPARIRIRELIADQLPDSNDISFAGGWANEPGTAATAAPVISRWTQ